LIYEVIRCPRFERMAKDPICGMMVNERKSKLKSEYEGMIFCFCSAGCKTTFDDDPRRYAHPR